MRSVAREVANPAVIYEPFDFHKECSKMRWDRLSILMDRLSTYLEQFGYFLQVGVEDFYKRSF